MVFRRGAHRSKEQDHAALGEARLATIRPQGLAHGLDIHLRRDPPRDGKGAALILPKCDTYAMSLHLAEISKHVAPDAHAVLMLDQAGWHMTDKLDVPGNITILPLPAKCPELNPTENVWQFMRDNYLSNRVFKCYDDIVAHCCDAWNELTDQPWRIMSIGLRDWAYRF
ncbi:hypothetical protein DSM21852_03860 [Methylocystis bryophila]|nr:hypothetical protein DSM21852_03860 [Methylocystis bryophila]